MKVWLDRATLETLARKCFVRDGRRELFDDESVYHCLTSVQLHSPYTLLSPRLVLLLVFFHAGLHPFPRLTLPG